MYTNFYSRSVLQTALFFLFIFLHIQSVFCQQLPLCQGGEQLAHSCSTACILCDLDGYSNATIQVTPGDPPPGFCTFQVHNIGWVGFVAGSTDLTFEVEVFPCTLGNSIEMGIYEAPNCMNSVLVGTCNTEMIENNTYTFNNDVPLNPGCVYFLVFDNNGPAECPFTITVTSGSAAAPNSGPTPTPFGATEVCPGATVNYSIPPVGSCDYVWTAPPGCLINGSPSPVSIQGDAGASVDITFGNTAGDICVETGNVCSGYSNACLAVTMMTIPPTTLPPVSICNNTSLDWIDGETYGSTQLMSTTFPSWLGCDSVVNQQLIVRPPITTNLGTIFSCPNECVEVGGNMFCSTGFYQVTLTSYLNCDSILIFAVNQSAVNAVVAPPDTIDCLQSSVLLNGSGSSSNANYAWYNSQNMLLGTNNTLTVSSPGVYQFIVEKVLGNLVCRDTALVTVIGSMSLPIISAIGDTLNCRGDSLQINGSSNFPGSTFTWTGPGIDSTNQHLEDPWVIAPGNYILTVVNPLGGCSAKDTAMVTSMGLAPDLTIPDKDTVNCSAPLIWLIAHSSVPGVQFNWLAPDSTLIASDSAQANQNGLWIAFATAVGGCVSIDTSLILIDTLLPGAVATGGSLDCSGTPIGIHGNSIVPGATFSWTGPNGFAANIPDTVVTIAGAYVLTVSTTNGCTSSATATVLANTNVPNLSSNAVDTLNCIRKTVNLFASSNSPGAVIDWMGPGGFSANGNTANATLAGAYTATATTPNGCQSSVVLVVPIDTIAPVLTVQGDTIDCHQIQGHVIGYCAESFIQYQWSGPGVLDPTAAETPVIFPGVYTLTVKDSVSGCTAVAQTTVSGDITPPQLTASQPSAITCTDPSVLLWASSSDNGVNFNWTGPAGFSNNNDSVLVNVPGSYLVFATGLNGCLDSILLTVPANTTPPDLTAIGGMINCAQPTVQINGQTNTPGVTFLWSGPNGFNSSSQNPIVSEAGVFQVVGTGTNGCIQTAQTQVIADFTPPTLTLSSSIQTLNCTNTSSVLQAQSNLPGTGFQWSFQGSPVGNNPTLTAQSAGTYTVTGTAGNGCTATNTIVIQEDIALPNVFATGATLFCQSQSASISGGSATPGTSLLWSGPGNFSSTQNMPSVGLPGNYILTVTAPNGCTSSAIATVVPDATAPDLSVQPAATLTCSITSTALQANSNTAGVVYSWTGPGSFSASGAMVQTQTPGIYTVQALALNGCSNFQTVTVLADTTAPMATASSGILTCTNQTTSLNGSSNTNGVQFNWTGPNNFMSSQANATATIPGLYQLLLTANNGCTGTSTTQVLQDTVSPDLALSGNTLLTCAQTSSTLIANSTTNGVGWSWAGPGNFSATVATITVNIPGNYTTTATAPNGCTTSTGITVDQNTIMPGAQASGGLITCASTSLSLSAQSNDPGASFQWAGPGQFSASGPMPTANMQGTYTVTVTGANGCISTASAQVTADQAPPAFVLTGNVISCATPIVPANASGFGNGTTFNWSGPGGFLQSGALVMISIPGTYQVNVLGANGCTASGVLVIGTDTIAPSILLEGGALNCRDSVVQIFAEVNPASAQLSWSGPQPNLPAQAEIFVSAPGAYTLSATSSNGCSAESAVIVAEIIPTWNIDLGPDQTVWEGSFVNIQAELTLPNQDISAITWTQEFSCAHCLQQSLKAKDSIFLSITVEDKFGCLMTDGIQINVRRRGEIYVPNVFSPDGDGNNDEFRVFSGNPAIKVRSLQVFDRWGALIFRQENYLLDDIKGAWNGYFRGSLMRPAVFVWTLEVEYEDGSTELLSGDVLLKL